jgi:hypothetical protein
VSGTPRISRSFMTGGNVSKAQLEFTIFAMNSPG